VAGALAAAFVIVAVSLALIRQTPSGVAQAAQILRDVQAVAAAPAGQGVATFTMTIVVPFLTVVDGRAVIPDPEADTDEARSNIWFQEPDRRRWESKLRTAQGELATSIVAVWDGIDWWFDVTNTRGGDRTIRVFRQQDRPAVAAGGLSVPTIAGPGAADLTALLAGVADCYRGEVVGADVIAGRATYVVNLGRSRCAGTVDVDPHGVSGAADRVIWVDRETAFVLKDELHDAAGNVLAGTTSLVTQIEYNVPIAAERFQFVVPPGVPVTDCRSNIECE
jgi:outer membrane lipoprotein-sorting protein